MRKQVLVLGAGFAGLELSKRLSESVAGEVDVTLIDRNDSFGFGFSKLDLLLGRSGLADVRLSYGDVSMPGVEFRRESVTAIDPARRRVTTDGGDYEADFLAVALGADYDVAATPGFGEGGSEYYSFAGAAQMPEVLAAFESGAIVIAIMGQPFKCPPAPFEGALLLHDQLVERGIRDAAEIRVVGPMAAPVPVTPEISQQFLDVLGERGIEYVAQRHVAEIDSDGKRVGFADGDSLPYDLLIGVPVHRVPDVVEASGLAVDGWVPVEPANLRTRFDGVYALGDVAGLPMAKAGVFAEAAAVVVADDIIARLRGGELEHRYEGAGHCFVEFGGGRVGKVEANFLGGPKPAARLVGPSVELADEKRQFARSRRERWFAGSHTG